MNDKFESAMWVRGEDLEILIYILISKFLGLAFLTETASISYTHHIGIP